MKLQARLAINFVCLSLTDLSPELVFVTRKDELHELLVAQTASSIQVVKLHEKLTILDCKLPDVILNKEVVKVNGVYFVVIIRIKAFESCIRLEIVEHGKLLTVQLHIELKFGNLPEEVGQLLLGLCADGHFSLFVRFNYFSVELSNLI
jgi:hypothetical protein